MKDLLEYLLTEITGSKDFEIKEEVDGNFSRLTVYAPKESIGIVIGKEGRTVKALRNILKIKATLEKKGVYVSVEEKTESTQKDSPSD